MKCANCENEDTRTLWNEDDTIYCSKCCHRTSVDTEEDDVVECPYCHRMRDRKAMYCRYCNDSAWESSTRIWVCNRHSHKLYNSSYLIKP